MFYICVMKNNNKFPNKLFLPFSGKTIWISQLDNKVKDKGQYLCTFWIKKIFLSLHERIYKVLIILDCDTLYSELLQIGPKGPLVSMTIVLFCNNNCSKTGPELGTLLFWASELATRWHKLCRLWYMSIDSGNLH